MILLLWRRVIIIADKFPAGYFIFIIFIDSIAGYLTVAEPESGVTGGFNAFQGIGKATEATVLKSDERGHIVFVSINLCHRAGYL